MKTVATPHVDKFSFNAFRINPTMAEEFRVLRPLEYHTQLISRGQRSDGRKLHETRELKLETDAIRTADSSSLVKLGNTSLICGCTTRISKVQAKSDEMDEFLKIKVDLPPICSSPTSQRTQHTAQLLTKTLKNILDDCNCFDNQGFYLSDSDSYYSVDVEVICLNYDGSLLDAALIAIIVALKTLKLSDKSANTTNHTIKLDSIPVCSSFAMIGDYIISDPNLEEETVAHSIFSVSVDSKTNNCCHINKIGGRAISTDNLLKCITLARERASKVVHIYATLLDDKAMDCV